MKLRCDRRALLEVASLVGSVSANRTTRPVLQHMLLVAKDGELELMATDLELAARNSIETIECEEEGSITLPASRFLSILRELRGETVDLSTDGLVALIRGNSSQFHLSGEHPDDFPDVPSGEGETFFEIPAPLFRDLAEKTEFAASRELGRYAINGLLIEFEGTTVRFVATDGRRLAIAEQALDVEVTVDAREILPLKGVTAFLKSIGPEVEMVGLCLSGRKTLLRGGKALFAATSIEADFPDYRMVLDHARGEVVQLERDEFFSCVRQAAVMAGEDVRSVTLDFEEGALVVSSSVEGLGDARSEMALDYAGPKQKVGFNPDFLLDFAKLKLPEQLPFSFADSAVSAMFMPSDGFRYVVMPVNTS